MLCHLPLLGVTLYKDAEPLVPVLPVLLAIERFPHVLIAHPVLPVSGLLLPRATERLLHEPIVHPVLHAPSVSGLPLPRATGRLHHEPIVHPVLHALLVPGLPLPRATGRLLHEPIARPVLRALLVPGLPLPPATGQLLHEPIVHPVLHALPVLVLPVLPATGQLLHGPIAHPARLALLARPTHVPPVFVLALSTIDLAKKILALLVAELNCLAVTHLHSFLLPPRPLVFDAAGITAQKAEDARDAQGILEVRKLRVFG